MFVSVPFSMGTVLHPLNIARITAQCRSFSPLLDGDGVASRLPVLEQPASSVVSVPFSMGTVLHRSQTFAAMLVAPTVSVPFSMGTVLHLELSEYTGQVHNLFQSPSRWGRCCILRSWLSVLGFV